MYMFFEYQSHLQGGLLISESTAHFLVLSSSRKKIKIKMNSVVFTSEKDLDIPKIFEEAEKILEEDPISIEFLWSSIEENLSSVKEIAETYFGKLYQEKDIIAIYLLLSKHPIYFYRRNQGFFLKAPRENIDSALVGLQRKKNLLLRIQSEAELLMKGILPPNWGDKTNQILFEEKKHTEQHKALELVSAQTSMSVQEIFQKCNALTGPENFHKRQFFYQYPYLLISGQAVYLSEGIEINQFHLSLSPVKAFSIDDSTTTEIDDAFSYEEIDLNQVRIGIHIAAPALGMQFGDNILHNRARKILSTIYLPSEKYTMLPSYFVKNFSLLEKTVRPSLSLYLHVDITNWAILKHEICLEKIYIEENLRTPLWEDIFNEETVLSEANSHRWVKELKVLYNFCKHRRKIRSEASNRGNFSYAHKKDFSFSISAEKEVHINWRFRDSPLNIIVSELMIENNAIWTEKISSTSSRFCYRGVENNKVRLSSTPLPHPHMGLESYGWTTSPLRRYIDLINQKQLLTQFFSVGEEEDPQIWKNLMTEFETAHQNYDSFQKTMENYWTLKWLEQQKKPIECLVQYIGNHMQASAKHAPLSCKPPGLCNYSAEEILFIEAEHIDFWNLNYSAKIISLTHS